MKTIDPENLTFVIKTPNDHFRNHNIHTTNIVGAWVKVEDWEQLPKDGRWKLLEVVTCEEDKESDYIATNDNDQREYLCYGHMIKAYAYITGPNFKKETINNE